MEIRDKLIRDFKDAGHHAVKTYGKNKVFDVIAFAYNEVWAVRIKQTKNNNSYNHDINKDIEKLEKVKVPFNVHKFLYIWQEKHGWIYKTQIKKFGGVLDVHNH